ncbi:MAG: hypothetical protein JWO40_187 [Candidatus Doudnabacteria bacterium]|nr:hypothetical protein [Candidatus Doudnabacteria bacterium]
MAQYYKGKKTFAEHLKQILWHILYPIFPYVRDGLLKLKIVHHSGRQNFYLGHLSPNYTIEHYKERLRKHNFHHHVVAWEDEGEILVLRKHDSFRWQHHLRLFEDREIRGHYELTPESNPIDHFFEKDFRDAREQFRFYLGDMLIEDESRYTKSHNLPDASTAFPYNGK